MAAKKVDYSKNQPPPAPAKVAQHKTQSTPLPAGAPKPGFLGSKKPTPGSTINHPGTSQAVPPKKADGTLGY